MAEAALRALVVDDSPDIRDSMVLVLELLGCRADAHATAEEALTALIDTASTEAPVAVALIDVSLAGMSGYALAEAARARLSGACPLLVAMTGWGGAADRARALEAGFDVHLLKPIELQQLQDLLERARLRRSAGPR